MSDSSFTPQGRPMLAEIILPELVWEKALEFVTDPEDVLNCGKTCTLFERLLHSKMVAANLNKIFPFLMDYLDNKSILNCRSVSKGWRDAVDNYFEYFTMKKTFYNEPEKTLKQFRATTFGRSLYNFSDKNSYDSGWENSDFERFATEMKDHPRNPFIGRTVLFRFYPKEEDERNFHFVRTVYNFFEIFGTHIWRLDLEINDTGGRYSTQVREEYIFPFIIRDVFLLAPNLKQFNLHGSFWAFTAANQSLNVEEITALPPPPALENLNVGNIFFSHNDNFRVRGAVDKSILLRHSNTNLRILHIKSIEAMRDLHWPNLKELHFTENLHPDPETNVIRYPGRNMRLFDPLLLNLISVPKLELLSVTVWCTDFTSGLMLNRKTLGDFFRALESLCIVTPNLKTLRFNNTWLWDKDLDEPEGICGDLRCPENIKTLEIREGYAGFLRNRHVISDYSFLLQFPQVEKIRIIEYGLEFTSEELEKISAGEIVQVHKFMYCGRMYESNIWKLLPSLNEFSFKKRVYTRASYERQ